MPFLLPMCNFAIQTQFIEKNNDALHASLEFLFRESKNGLVKQLFEAVEISTGKLNFISVGSKFRSQLVVLMEKLKATVSSNGTVSSFYNFSPQEKRLCGKGNKLQG